MLFRSVSSENVYIKVWDAHAIKEHDIEMTFEEWDTFKKIIDMGIARAICK